MYLYEMRNAENTQRCADKIVCTPLQVISAMDVKKERNILILKRVLNI